MHFESQSIFPRTFVCDSDPLFSALAFIAARCELRNEGIGRPAQNFLHGQGPFDTLDTLLSSILTFYKQMTESPVLQSVHIQKFRLPNFKPQCGELLVIVFRNNELYNVILRASAS